MANIAADPNVGLVCDVQVSFFSGQLVAVLPFNSSTNDRLLINAVVVGSRHTSVLGGWHSLCSSQTPRAMFACAQGFIESN